MPNLSSDKNAKCKQKYRFGKKLREKLTKTFVNVKIEVCEPEPVTFVVHRVPKEIFELQELETQIFCSYDCISLYVIFTWNF